jgi:hypothetical protein
MYPKKESITATVSYVKSLALYMVLYMSLGFFLSVSYAGKIHSVTLAIIGCIVFIIVPLVFNKPYRMRFMKILTLTFKADTVDFTISNFNTHEIEKEFPLEYKNIKSCTLTSTSKKTSTIRIFLYTGRKIQYGFVDEGDEDKIPKDNNVSLDVFKQLYLFNNTIVLLPPFYASKSGIAALVVLTVAFIVAIVINILYKPIAIPSSLFSAFALYLNIIVRRKRDIRIFKEMTESLTS